MENWKMRKEIIEKTDICDRPALMTFVLGLLETRQLRILYNGLPKKVKPKEDFNKIYV